MPASFAKAIERRWYSAPGILWLLYPFSLLFQLISYLRRRSHLKSAVTLPVPVCVVGNISVGGTGKTPTIIALVQALNTQGIRVGVVARGYGAALTKGEVAVLNGDSTSAVVGDEPLLIFKRTGCPVAVGAHRAEACLALLREHTVDIILSDDGMQHYKLPRQFELALLDGDRMLGNGCLLPVGPLRETPQRLASVDWVLINGGQPELVTQKLKALRIKTTLPPLTQAELKPSQLVNVLTGQSLPLSSISELARVVAVAGIGNPKRFYRTLNEIGLNNFTRCEFPDHYSFSAQDFAVFEDRPILMTEKDAVKCKAFATASMWYLPVDLMLPHDFVQSFTARARELINSHK